MILIKGIYHIQHINNYHSQLERFLLNHHGVSMKYLDNYLVWHNFMNYSKGCREEKKTVMLSYVLTQCMTFRTREMPHRDPLPLVA